VILLIDNYDSFSYNPLTSSASSARVVVRRNDAITPEEADALTPRT